MPGVVLIDRNGSEWEVRSPSALTDAVFRDGMRLKSGTIQENILALQLSVAVAPTLNDPILKRDIDTDEEREAFIPARLSAARIATFGAPPAQVLRPQSPRPNLNQPTAETTLASFAAGHGWTSTGAWASSNLNDVADNGWANQVISGATPGVNNSGCNFQRTGLTAFDATGRFFRMLVKCSDPSKLNAVQLYISDTTAFTNNALLAAVPGNGAGLLPNQWTVVTFSLDRATVTATPPNYAAITALRIRVADIGTPVTVAIGGLSMTPRPAAYPNGVVSLSFDDGFASHYSYAREVLNRYRFRATLFPILDTLGTPGRLTEAQIAELAQLSGWEVGAHSTTLAVHNAGLPALSAAEKAAEMDALKVWLLDRGYADLYAYPINAYDTTSVAAVGKRFTIARTTDGSLKETPYAGNPLLLRSLSLTAGSTVASVQTAIDQAYTHGHHLILTMHDVVATGATGNQFGGLSAVVDYLATKGIPVRPIGEALSAL